MLVIIMNNLDNVQYNWKSVKAESWPWQERKKELESCQHLHPSMAKDFFAHLKVRRKGNCPLC